MKENIENIENIENNKESQAENNTENTENTENNIENIGNNEEYIRNNEENLNITPANNNSPIPKPNKKKLGRPFEDHTPKGKMLKQLRFIWSDKSNKASDIISAASLYADLLGLKPKTSVNANDSKDSTQISFKLCKPPADYLKSIKNKALNPDLIEKKNIINEVPYNENTNDLTITPTTNTMTTTPTTTTTTTTLLGHKGKNSNFINSIRNGLVTGTIIDPEKPIREQVIRDLTSDDLFE
jgi:hypothetical protein